MEGKTSNRRWRMGKRFVIMGMLWSAAVILFWVWTSWLASLLALLLVPLLALIRHPGMLRLRQALNCNWVYFPLVALLSITLAVFLRIFAIGVYGIPSGSMETTILPGDQVFVSKWHYGPRMPQYPAEIPWFGILFSKSAAQWDFRRLPGAGTFQRGDLMVFNRKGKATPYIKRCAGLPGDTLSMAGWELYVNGGLQEAAPGIKHTVAVYFNDRKALGRWYQKHNADWRNQEYKNGRGYWHMGLDKDHRQALRRAPFVDSLIPRNPGASFSYIISNENRHSEYPIRTYRKKSYLEKTGQGWKHTYFGPLQAPYKGLRIKLTESNARIYGQVIREYEGDSLQIRAGRVFLNNRPARHYSFSQNYYFMLGDNRDYSSDSRHWGFVPQRAIIGRAVLVLFNSRWKHLKNGRILRVMQ